MKYYQRLIAIRKINIDEVNLYLNPKLKNTLPDPFILKDMDKSVERCIKAIINKEKIGIFGDYDVDGATSTAILGNYFKDIGLIYQFIFLTEKPKVMVQLKMDLINL